MFVEKFVKGSQWWLWLDRRREDISCTCSCYREHALTKHQISFSASASSDFRALYKCYITIIFIR